MSEQKKAKKSVADETYDQLLNMIVKGKFGIGEKLPSENELKELFGVSRNTVRTTLNRLNVLGVVTTKRGDGTFVRQFDMENYMGAVMPAVLLDSDNLMEVLEFRKGVESEAARLAALNATQDDIEAMESCLLQESRYDITGHEYNDGAMRFHNLVARASKNQILIRVSELLRYVLTERMEGFLAYEWQVSDSQFYHNMILESIKAKKSHEASYIMERHMVTLIQQVSSGYAQFLKENQQIKQRENS